MNTKEQYKDDMSKKKLGHNRLLRIDTISVPASLSILTRVCVITFQRERLNIKRDRERSDINCNHDLPTTQNQFNLSLAPQRAVFELQWAIARHDYTRRTGQTGVRNGY